MEQNYPTFKSLEYLSHWSLVQSVITTFLFIWFFLSIILLLTSVIYLFLNKNNQDKKPLIIRKITRYSWSIAIIVGIWFVWRLLDTFFGISFLGNISIPKKPVIYLYPVNTTKVSVKVNYQPGFLATYPLYQNGWNVVAHPDGKLINISDGKEYSYLYWEGKSNSSSYDLSTGFMVKGEDTAIFLQDKLALIGLTPKEYNEFIVYWLPQMVNNPYNLIHFATNEEYDKKVPLDINPSPDSVLRVFMVYKPLSKYQTIKPQSFVPFMRNGFTVVEWGGSKLE